MCKKMIIFFLAVAVGLLLNDSGLRAQQKYSTQPKQVQPSQPAQQAGSRVTFSKSSSAVSQPVAMVSPQNLPRALTPEQRKQAIQEARRLAGVEKPTLHPNPPAKATLTPITPKDGNSFIETKCMSTYPGLNVPMWKWGGCGDYSDREILLKAQTTPGKAYLLDVSVRCSKPEAFLFTGSFWAKVGIKDDHIMAAFVARENHSVISFRPEVHWDNVCYITKVEIIPID
jgi:hypothetical protein